MLIFKKLIPNSQLIKIQLFRSFLLINSELLISFTASTFSIVYKNYKYGQLSGLQKYFLFLNLQILVSLNLKFNTKILKVKRCYVHLKKHTIHAKKWSFHKISKPSITLLNSECLKFTIHETEKLKIMKATITQLNTVLFIALSTLVVLGLMLLACGIDWLSKDFLLVAAFTFPIVLASKGIQFIIEKQLRKALMSIVMLSVICLLALLFVFV